MTLGYGLIGCGSMGRELATAVLAIPEARLAAAFDPFQAHLERLCAETGAAAADSLDALLAREDVEAVIVASPNHLHCEHTLTAAAAGKHVFCEKPMALSVADCDRMIAACEGRGLRLMVGHSMRFYPITKRLLELTTGGELGEPRFAFGSYCFSGFKDRPSGIWHLDRARSGGLFFHMGIHHIDLLNAILGPARRVQYAGGRYGAQVHDFDDIASMIVEYRSGATGVLTTASICPVNWREFAFLLSKGFIRMDSPWSYLEYGDADDRMARLMAGDLPPQNAVETELASFTQWVLRDATPLLTAAEGRAAVAVAEAAQRAKERGGPVEVAA